jgi:hypothetical protein
LTARKPRPGRKPKPTVIECERCGAPCEVQDDPKAVLDAAAEGIEGVEFAGSLCLCTDCFEALYAWITRRPAGQA